MQRAKELNIELDLWKIKTASNLDETSIVKANEKAQNLLEEIYSPPTKGEIKDFICEFYTFLKFLEKNKNFNFSKTECSEILNPDFYGLSKIDISAINFKPIYAKYLKLKKGSRKLNCKLKARGIADFFAKYIEEIRIEKEISIRIHKRKLFSVGGNRIIYIPRKAFLPLKRLIQTANHEILGHVYRSYCGETNVNNKNQSLKLLGIRTLASLKVEEGIATYLAQNAFYKSSKYDLPNLINLYLRLITYHLAKKFEPEEVFSKVTELAKFEYFFKGEENETPEQIRKQLITRVYRHLPKVAKGFANPYISQYLLGNRIIWEYLEKKLELSALFIGKIDLKVIKKLKTQGFKQNNINKFLKKYHAEFSK